MNNIKWGWFVPGVIVNFTRQWCIYCAKNRLHEVHDQQTFCIGCGNIEAYIEPEEANCD